jgi:hypothetical protein
VIVGFSKGVPSLCSPIARSTAASGVAVKSIFDLIVIHYWLWVYQVESGEADGLLGQGIFSNLGKRYLAVQYPTRDSKTEMEN